MMRVNRNGTTIGPEAGPGRGQRAHKRGRGGLWRGSSWGPLGQCLQKRLPISSQTSIFGTKKIQICPGVTRILNDTPNKV